MAQTRFWTIFAYDARDWRIAPATSRGSLRTRTIPARLDRHVRPGPDRDPDIGRGEGRRVVDAVADHRDSSAALLEAADGVGLLGWQDLRRDLVDAEAPRNGVGNGLGIAGDHGHPEAEGMQPVDRLRGPGPHLVLGSERTDDTMVIIEPERAYA